MELIDRKTNDLLNLKQLLISQNKGDIQTATNLFLYQELTLNERIDLCCLLTPEENQKLSNEIERFVINPYRDMEFRIFNTPILVNNQLKKLSLNIKHKFFFALECIYLLDNKQVSQFYISELETKIKRDPSTYYQPLKMEAERIVSLIKYRELSSRNHLKKAMK